MKTAVFTTVVNLKHEPFDVYIGRAVPGWSLSSDLERQGYYGNPYRLRFESERPKVLLQYLGFFERKVYAAFDSTFRERIETLKGKRLGCYCRPLLCHGDVIAAWLNDGQAGLDHLRNRLEGAS